jgi:hypothetical protein
VDLVSLNRKDAPVFYDSDTDTLFFMDSEAPAEAGNYNNVYRLDLSNKFYLFKDLIRPKAQWKDSED